MLVMLTLPGFCAGAATGLPAVPGLVTSEVYNVTVDDQPVWTEAVKTSYDLKTLPDWFLSSSYVSGQQELHLANLTCDGPFHVRIETPRPIRHAAVRPASRGFTTTIRDRVLEFAVPGPDWLYLTIDDLPPLLLFANPPETNVPQPGDPHVRYFPPGIHRPGLMELHDGDSVYLAAGAVVYGGIRVTGATGIRVFGRGVLDGNFEHRLVHIWNSRNITFEGVILRNGDGWTNTLENCEDVTYRDVKVISFGPSGDGINPLGSRRVSIEHCFLRCTDDCIAIKAPDAGPVVENVRVRDCTMVGFAYADGVTIGFETNTSRISDILIQNCDILQARGGSRVGGHSAFSIICDGPARISDVRYEDIRVEEDVLKLFELHVTDGTKYDVDPPGHIADVHLKNITWASARPIILRGFSTANRVSGVVFENCTIAGVPLTGPRADLFQVNEFVDDVRFVSPAQSEVPASAP